MPGYIVQALESNGTDKKSVPIIRAEVQHSAPVKAFLKSIPITDVVARLGLKKGRGVNNYYCYNGHDNASPSLTLYPDTNSYHCFGCQEGGDVITLIMQYRKGGGAI